MAAPAVAKPEPKPVISVVPADTTSGVAVTQPVVVRAVIGRLERVLVTGPAGRRVAGKLDLEGASWTARAMLAPSTTYHVATIASAGNQRLSRVTTFTTVRPTALAFPSVVPLNGETVGVGMVIRVLFDHPVRDHAAAERVMSVTSSKPAVGAFHWFGDYEVHYRPRTYWPAYSKVTLHIGIGGRPLGNGVFGERSRTITFHTGAAMITRVSNATKQLTTTVNGRQVMSAPVSLGKPSTPSSSGTLLVMTIEHNHVMDSSTYGVPADAPGGYRTTVEWALRVTNGGEFLHSAPWSVNQQGRFNVSHGCINIRTAVAKWFYDNSHRGDVVVVTGTERAVQPGDGWTDWRFGWSEWKAGSALA